MVEGPLMAGTNTHNRHRYEARRAAEGRCLRCGEKLTPGYKFKTCAVCLDGVREYSKVWRTQKRLEPSEPEEAVRVQEGARCRVCSLLLPHERCLGGSAEDRPGAGRVYPEGGV